MATKTSAAKKTARKPAAAAKKTTTVSATAKMSTKFKFSNSPLLAASVAELVGTFLLTAVILLQSGAPLAVLFGLLGIVLGFGAISGAHFNPAITVGAWATRRVNTTRTVAYVVAQVLGALLALTVVNAYVTSAPETSSQASLLGQSAPQLFKAASIPTDKEWLVLWAELLGAAIFGYAFAAVSREKGRALKAFGIASGLFVGILVAGTLASYVGVSTGTLLNPAVAGALQELSWNAWPIAIYVLAPVVGAVVGFALQDLLQKESEA